MTAISKFNKTKKTNNISGGHISAKTIQTFTKKDKVTKLTPSEKLGHEFLCTLGIETKNVERKAGLPNRVENRDGKPIVTQKATPATETIWYEPKPAFAAFANKGEEIASALDATTQKIIAVCTKVIRGFSCLVKKLMKAVLIDMIIILVLLAIRQYLPEVASQLPNLYKLVDGVFVPVYEFVFDVIYNAFMETAKYLGL